MKGIDSYIIEKLHLNKDIQVNKSNEEILELICKTASLDKDDNNIYNALNNWLQDNNVSLVKIYLLFTVNMSDYVKSLDNEILNKVNLLSIGKFVDKYKEVFNTDNDLPSRFLLYKSDEVKISGMSKGLLISADKYELIVEKKATIYD